MCSSAEWLVQYQINTMNQSKELQRVILLKVVLYFVCQSCSVKYRNCFVFFGDSRKIIVMMIGGNIYNVPFKGGKILRKRAV